MTAEEAIAYIENYTWSASRLGLERTQELLRALGDPQKQLKFVHVAGSNGKGSTCAMTESILRAAGYRTGLYISPYIQDFCERMQVNGENIPGERLAAITQRVRTIADAMDVLQDENTEDIEKMAAITPTDKPYLKMGVFEIWKKRFPWLLLLMVSATFTGRIIQSFESALQAYVVLTAYIPMLMGTGGNCGAQSSTTIIRGLSLGEIRFRDTFKVIWKEFRVAFFCGATRAAVNFGRLMLMDHVSVVVAAIVSLSMILTIVLAKFIGSLLPILAKRIHLDPAVMANPFISTIVDALSLLIYFEVASWLLPI